MSFFWTNVFEYFKERRYAAVFFSSLAMVGIVFAIAALFFQVTAGIDWQPYWPEILLGFGVILAAIIWRFFRLARAARLNRYESSPLSRDELSKARSKLRKQSTFKSL